MANATNFKMTGNNVLLVSDNLNYLCLKAKDILENHGADSLEVVYNSVMNTDNKGTVIDYDNLDNTITRMRDLLGTSNYTSIWIKGFSSLADSNLTDVTKKKRGRKPNNEKLNDVSNSTVENVVKSKRGRKPKNDKLNDVDSNTVENVVKSKRGRKPKNVNMEVESNSTLEKAYKNPTGRRGAPSLSQDVLDFRYDVISDYDDDKISTNEAIEKLGVTEGVFRNLVSEFHRCKKSNRRKAFGKSGIINRTYKLYSENKISSNEAAENIGVSVATFLNWYKTDNGIDGLERGRKSTKSK